MIEAALVTTIVSLANKVVALIPNYDQRKLKEFSDLQLEYTQELKKALPERDDDKIMNLREELLARSILIDKESNK